MAELQAERTLADVDLYLADQAMHVMELKATSHPSARGKALDAAWARIDIWLDERNRIAALNTH